MKIIQLTAENIKRLKAVEIRPDGNTVVISGRNAQGKTSVLDAIWFALGGAAAAKNTPQPIREGEDHAKVTVDLGDIVVTRSWTESGSYLKVENADGAVYRSPQQLLDEMVGRLSFDPLAFAQQSPRAQRDILLQLVELPFDLDVMAAERDSLYNERTLVGREVTQLRGQLELLPPGSDDLPEIEVDVQELRTRLHAAIDARDIRRQAEQDLQWAKDALQHAEADLLAAQRRLAQQQEVVDDRRWKLEQAPLAESTEQIMKEIERAEATNDKIQQRNEWIAAMNRRSEVLNRYDGFTESIEALDRAKREGIEAAEMPIPGLGFDEDGVTYEGHPFSQCSSAEQLRVSLAIAMALNPKVRVIRITDGSLLDRDNMALIEQMAAEHDYQIWIERVDESGKVGIYIEDGEVMT